jgi:hypothetical protein
MNNINNNSPDAALSEAVGVNVIGASVPVGQARGIRGGIKSGSDLPIMTTDIDRDLPMYVGALRVGLLSLASLKGNGKGKQINGYGYGYEDGEGMRAWGNESDAIVASTLTGEGEGEEEEEEAYSTFGSTSSTSNGSMRGGQGIPSNGSIRGGQGIPSNLNPSNPSLGTLSGTASLLASLGGKLYANRLSLSSLHAVYEESVCTTLATVAPSDSRISRQSHPISTGQVSGIGNSINSEKEDKEDKDDKEKDELAQRWHRTLHSSGFCCHFTLQLYGLYVKIRENT